MTEDFKTALRLFNRNKDRKRVSSAKEITKELWGMLGDIKAKCPHCQHIQSVRTIKSRTCIGCGRSFTVDPVNKPSRIVWCHPKKKSILFNIQSLTRHGRFVNVL